MEEFSEHEHFSPSEIIQITQAFGAGGQNDMEPVILIGNPYGFQVNVYHSVIQPQYMKYRKRHGLSTIYPIGDKDRRRFEKLMLRYIRRKLKEESGKQQEKTACKLWDAFQVRGDEGAIKPCMKI